ncbi:MAG: rhomboid family intramembrane serine protease [Lacipirellulaceae bacterium]
MLFPLYDRNPHRGFPVVTLLLIAANVLCFWLSISGGELPFIETVYERGFVPQRLTRLGEEEPVIVQQDLPDGRRLTARLSTAPEAVYGSMFSMMFLHGGWVHLLSNLWMLWVFGDNVEHRLGRFVYAAFYVVGGLVAVLTHWMIDPQSTQPVIGASGAVAAVLGAYTVSFPAAKVKTLLFIGIPLLLDLPALLVLGAWFALQMIAGLQVFAAPAAVDVSVAFWAHIGGYVTGLVLTPLLTIGASPPNEDWRSEARELFA